MAEEDYEISPDMAKLIVSYMDSCNNQEYAKSELLLQQIKEQGAIDHEKRST